MNSRIHISYPTDPHHPHTQREWMLPTEIKTNIVRILGGDPEVPDSIPIRPGHPTQSLDKISLTDILSTLGGKYMEIPSGKGIHYKNALRKGFKYIGEKLDGAWTFTCMRDQILRGYTHEKIHPITREVTSIGKYRTIEGEKHDAGPRYLIQYTEEEEMWDDYLKILTFEGDTESYQNACREMDDFDTGIF